MLGAINQSAYILASTLLLCVVSFEIGYGQPIRQSKVYEFNSKAVETKIAVAGAVKQPGSYQVDAKTNTLSSVLKRVGGLTEAATGHIYLVRQGRTSTLILEGTTSKQELANGDVIVACSRVESQHSGAIQGKPAGKSPTELHVVLIGAYADPVVLPIAPHENKLGILWGQILKQKQESLNQVRLMHMSQPRAPVSGVYISNAESALLDGSIILIPQGLFNLASVPHDLKEWLQNPDIFSQQQKQVDLEDSMQPAIPVSESQVATSPIIEAQVPTIPELPKAELEQSPMAFPLELKLSEIPGTEPKPASDPVIQQPQAKPASVQPLETLPEIIPENEVATLLIPLTNREQQSGRTNAIPTTYNSASVTLRNELNRSVPELSTQPENTRRINSAVNDHLLMATNVTDGLGSTTNQNTPWVIEGNLKSLESNSESAPALAPRRLTQTRSVEADAVVSGEVPLPIELGNEQSTQGASVSYLMVISSMAALFAVAMLIMSYTLSYRADEEEAATKLAAPADVKQNYQVQSETRTVRRHLQDLIENSIPIVEEKVHFPAEVTIYNLPQNVTKLRLDQDHLPQLQEVKSAEKTIMNNSEAEALEILNAVDNLPIGTSASIYRTDKSTGSIPAPVGGSRVDRALQKSQREESHS